MRTDTREIRIIDGEIAYEPTTDVDPHGRTKELAGWAVGLAGAAVFAFLTKPLGQLVLEVSQGLHR
jgi:hypothetical protein